MFFPTSTVSEKLNARKIERVVYIVREPLKDFSQERYAARSSSASP